MAQKSNFASKGRYGYGGGVVDYGTRLGWWEREVIPKSVTDVMVVLTSKYDKRPDLLAYDLYGSSTLMWVILQYNNIVDVNGEFVTGATLTVPTKVRVFTEILKKRQSAISEK